MSGDDETEFLTVSFNRGDITLIRIDGYDSERLTYRIWWLLCEGNNKCYLLPAILPDDDFGRRRP
jgi:hypothetical protein